MYLNNTNEQNPLSNFSLYHSHPLNLINVNKNCKCNICEILLNGNAYSCVSCDLNICQNCGNRLINGKPNTSVHMHQLQGIKGKNWKCDVCKKIYVDCLSFNCENCNFDCCTNCYCIPKQPQQQTNYQQQQNYAQQPNYQQQNYVQQNSYPPQSNYPQQQQPMYPQQSNQQQQSMYPQQSNQQQQSMYPQQSNYPQQQPMYPQQSNYPQQQQPMYPQQQQQPMYPQQQQQPMYPQQSNQQPMYPQQQQQPIYPQQSNQQQQPMYPQQQQQPMYPQQSNQQQQPMYPQQQPIYPQQSNQQQQPMYPQQSNYPQQQQPMYPQQQQSMYPQQQYGMSQQGAQPQQQFMNQNNSIPHEHQVSNGILNSRLKCDICGNHGTNQPCFSCRQCDLDICQDCCNKIFFSTQKNIHPHQLLLITHKNDWLCNVCRNYSRKVSMNCKNCNYNCCINCYSKGYVHSNNNNQCKIF